MSDKEKEVTSFKRISIPLVRRIYPQLIANNLCIVEPLMTLPPEEPSRKKIRKKKYRSIDEPWEVQS